MHHKTNTGRTWAGSHWGTGCSTGSCTVTAGIWERETGCLTVLVVCRGPQEKKDVPGKVAWGQVVGAGAVVCKLSNLFSRQQDITAFMPLTTKN